MSVDELSAAQAQPSFRPIVLKWKEMKENSRWRPRGVSSLPIRKKSRVAEAKLGRGETR